MPRFLQHNLLIGQLWHLKETRYLYDELLQPLQVAASKCQDVDPTHFIEFDNDNDLLPQHGMVIYVSKSFVILNLFIVYVAFNWKDSNNCNLSFVGAI